MESLKNKQILDACCGGKMWWWDKNHPLAVYIDKRESLKGSYKHRPNWSCQPDIIADFRDMPFEDETFNLVVFDPPHISQYIESGDMVTQYGNLQPETANDDLKKGFEECWRVLKNGGTLVFKWAGDIKRVQPHFPSEPIVGTRTPRGGQTRWFIFYKEI